MGRESFFRTCIDQQQNHASYSTNNFQKSLSARGLGLGLNQRNEGTTDEWQEFDNPQGLLLSLLSVMHNRPTKSQRTGQLQRHVPAIHVHLYNGLHGRCGEMVASMANSRLSRLDKYFRSQLQSIKKNGLERIGGAYAIGQEANGSF
jgi:hypothetical protein